MPDRRKRGRKSGPGTTLEKRVRLRCRELKLDDRARRFHGDGKINPVSLHMRLAQEFHLPCQQVLDIVDPDRSNQAVRIERYERQQRWREYSTPRLAFTNGVRNPTVNIVDHPHLWFEDIHSPELAVMCADPECDAWMGSYEWHWNYVVDGWRRIQQHADHLVVC